MDKPPGKSSHIEETGSAEEKKATSDKKRKKNKNSLAKIHDNVPTNAPPNLEGKEPIEQGPSGLADVEAGFSTPEEPNSLGGGQPGGTEAQHANVKKVPPPQNNDTASGLLVGMSIGLLAFIICLYCIFCCIPIVGVLIYIIVAAAYS